MSLYRRRVMEVKHPPNQIVATYNVTSTTSATKLFYNNSKKYIQSVFIDGENVGVVNSFTFATTGLHEVRFVISKSIAFNASYFFQGSKQLVSVDFSEMRSPLRSAYFLFDGCSALTSVKNIDFSGVTTLEYAFRYCSSLTTLDTSNWDLSSMTNGSNMFSSCTKLTTLDTSNWDLSSMTNGSSMFSGCAKLTTLDTSNWDLSSMTNGSSMFSGCAKLTTLDTSNWDLSSMTNGGYMFKGCNTTIPLDVSNWDLSNLTSGNYMFDGSNCLINANLSKWNLGKLTNGYCMFRSCKGTGATGTSEFNFQALTTATEMFRYCSLPITDVSKWGITKLAYASYMFSGCTGISTLDISNWDMSNVTTIEFMFNGSTLQSLRAHNLNLSKITSLTYVFESCYSLVTLDIPNWNVSGVTSATRTFCYSGKLETINAENWDLSKVTSFDTTFRECSSLISLTLNTEINESATFTNVFLLVNTNGTLFYYPHASFIEKFLPIVPSKWTKTDITTLE